MDAERARELLRAERERIERALKRLAHEDDSEPADEYDPGNLASDLYQDELDEGLEEDLREQLAAVERAEQRLAAGTYGLSVEGRAARRVLRPEHEVVDEELRAPSEEVRERGAAFVGLEAVVLVDPDPRKLLPLPRELVAPPGQLLLGLEQLEPRREPLLVRSRRVLRQDASSSAYSSGCPELKTVTSPETHRRQRKVGEWLACGSTTTTRPATATRCGSSSRTSGFRTSRS